MDAYRLSAAGGALALHALVLAGVLALTMTPSTKRPAEPVQVFLISETTQPEPLALARAPAPPPPEPPRAEPPRQPEPVAAARPPRPARPAPPRAPVATPAPPPPAASPTEPPLAAERASEPAPARLQPETPSNAIASAVGAASPPAPTAAAGAAAAAASAPSAPGTAARGGAAAGARSTPRVDATWSGNVPPPYPAMARRTGEQGEVRLDVYVDVDGRVTEVRLRQSSGSTLLDRTAIDTVRKWRFKPATVDGQPVAEWYHDWRWVFRLEG